MSAQQYDTVDLVLDDTMTAVCTATKATTTMIWKCVSAFHGDRFHYYQRVV